MKGIPVAVMTLPLTQALEPDFEAIAAMTETLCLSPIKALFPCASTGEFPHLSTEVNMEILRCTAQANKGRKLLYGGIASPNLTTSLRYLEEAKKLGYDVCVACPPYYYPNSQQEIFTFYKTLCDAAEGVDIIAYHVPFFTTGIELDTLQALLDATPLKGIKDSSANMKRIGHTIRLARGYDFDVYTGTDDCLIAALAQGCRGSMTALGASLPNHIANLYDAWERGDLPEAQRLQQMMMPLLSIADTLPFPLGYKLLAEWTHHLPTGNYLQSVAYEQIEDVRTKLKVALEKENLM